MNGIEKEVQRGNNEERYITNKTKKKGFSEVLGFRLLPASLGYPGLRFMFRWSFYVCSTHH
jgi:hypothetical protein